MNDSYILGKTKYPHQNWKERLRDTLAINPSPQCQTIGTEPPTPTFSQEQMVSTAHLVFQFLGSYLRDRPPKLLTLTASSLGHKTVTKKLLMGAGAGTTARPQGSEHKG